MSLSFLVGGTQGTFEDRVAREVAGVLDQGLRGRRETGKELAPQRFGEMVGSGWADLQARAVVRARRVGNLPNLLALGGDGRGVYLPTSAPRRLACRSAAGGPLRCASLPGLRRELAVLAERWDLPTDDDSLDAILQTYADPDDGPVADAPEILTYAQLILAANEAVRRGCPLWLVGERF